MNIAQLSEKLSARFIVCPRMDVETETFYAGDFLSRVMGKAPQGCAWFTVMSNVNVAGVAVLADVRAVVLCEGVQPDRLLEEKCREESIALLCTDKTVFDCCRSV